MYEDDKNEYGCPLRFQTGATGVKNFDALIERLSPDQRAAFEAQRAERQAEIDHYLVGSEYQT